VRHGHAQPLPSTSGTKVCVCPFSKIEGGQQRPELLLEVSESEGEME
jgi:hypothetical protein